MLDFEKDYDLRWLAELLARMGTTWSQVSRPSCRGRADSGLPDVASRRCASTSNGAKRRHGHRLQLPPRDRARSACKVRDFIDAGRAPRRGEDRRPRGRPRASSSSRSSRCATPRSEWGLWLPHMPKEYGGMGLGHVAMAAVSAEAAKSALRPVRAERPGARRGQHAHAAPLGDRRAEGEVPAAALRRASCARASR